MYKIFPSSEKALAEKETNRKTSVYPWEILEPKSSFIVNKSETTMKRLRTLASKHGKRLKRRFRVVDHGENVTEYEICRLPDLNEPNKTIEQPASVGSHWQQTKPE